MDDKAETVEERKKYEDLNKDITNLKTKIEDLNANVTDLRARLDIYRAIDLKAQLDNMSEEEREKKYKEIEKERDDYSKQVKDKGLEIDGKDKEIAKKNNEMEEVYAPYFDSSGKWKTDSDGTPVEMSQADKDKLGSLNKDMAALYSEKTNLANAQRDLWITGEDYKRQENDYNQFVKGYDTKDMVMDLYAKNTSQVRAAEFEAKTAESMFNFISNDGIASPDSKKAVYDYVTEKFNSWTVTGDPALDRLNQSELGNISEHVARMENWGRGFEQLHLTGSEFLANPVDKIVKMMIDPATDPLLIKSMMLAEEEKIAPVREDIQREATLEGKQNAFNRWKEKGLDLDATDDTDIKVGNDTYKSWSDIPKEDYPLAYLQFCKQTIETSISNAEKWHEDIYTDSMSPDELKAYEKAYDEKVKALRVVGSGIDDVLKYGDAEKSGQYCDKMDEQEQNPVKLATDINEYSYYSSKTFRHTVEIKNIDELTRPMYQANFEESLDSLVNAEIGGGNPRQADLIRKYYVDEKNMKDIQIMQEELEKIVPKVDTPIQKTNKKNTGDNTEYGKT